MQPSIVPPQVKKIKAQVRVRMRKFGFTLLGVLFLSGIFGYFGDLTNPVICIIGVVLTVLFVGWIYFLLTEKPVETEIYEVPGNPLVIR